MNTKGAVYLETVNPFLLGGLWVLYNVNEWFFRWRRLERFLWGCIQAELFYIGGGCRRSGNCCSKIMLYDKGVPINTEKAWNIYHQKQVRTPFYPISKKGSIAYYNCGWLTKENTCQSYKERPICCRQYPVDYFIAHGQILKGCGYQVKKSRQWPWFVKEFWTCKRLDNLITRVLYKSESLGRVIN